MMSTLYCVIAISATMLALVYLTLMDPKRIRVFKLKAVDAYPYKPRLAWVITFLPGIVLLFLGQASAFLAWLGAVPVVGWLLVLFMPKGENP